MDLRGFYLLISHNISVVEVIMGKNVTLVRGQSAFKLAVTTYHLNHLKHISEEINHSNTKCEKCFMASVLYLHIANDGCNM